MGREEESGQKEIARYGCRFARLHNLVFLIFVFLLLSFPFQDMYVPSSRSSPGDAAACSWGETGPEHGGQEEPGQSRKREMLL